MWPVMTLTLLLQLTDEEQLYADRQPEPAVIEATSAEPLEEPAASFELSEKDEAA